MCLLLAIPVALIFWSLPMTNDDQRMSASRRYTPHAHAHARALSLGFRALLMINMIFESYYRALQGLSEIHLHMGLVIG
jgi:hypothetical protein